MNPEQFKNSKSGKVIKTLEGYGAFVPNPLPPKIELNAELVNILSAADRAVGELAGVGRTLANPHLLIRPFIRREAVLSSRIEGTLSSLSDLFFFEAAGRDPEKQSDVQEVANYVTALEYGLTRLESLPMSLRLIRELHKHLMKGVRGESQGPGEFRRSQNWIGRPGAGLNDATFVPPPVDTMMGALDDFEKYLHRPQTLPPLVNLAVIHHQFETVHPFLDGNGRIGRLLTTLLLCQWGILPQPLLYLSAFFEKHRSDYYDLLLSVSQTGDYASWIKYFLSGVTEMSTDAILRSRRLNELHAFYRQRFQEARTSGLLLSLVDLIFERPLISISDAKKRLGASYNATKKYVNQLVDAGVLKETTGRERYRYFIAGEILAAIEAPLMEENI